MFGAFERHLTDSFQELMKELRAIRAELEVIRDTLADERPHAALRPVGGRPAVSSRQS